ncbi:MAG: energy transducer TonB [Pseudomonas sp.]
MKAKKILSGCVIGMTLTANSFADTTSSSVHFDASPSRLYLAQAQLDSSETEARLMAEHTAKAKAVADAKTKAVESAVANAKLKAIENSNDARYSGGLSEALQNNKDKGLDWFKNKVFKLDKAAAITACDPGICYVFAFNGLSPLGVTQEDQDFNGRQLQGQLVRVIGTDRFGNIMVTRLTSDNKPSQTPRPSAHEIPSQQPNLPSPVLATYDEIVNSIDGLIVEQTAENWTRPKSARNGMTVVLLIEMLQDGTMKSVSVVKSSGDTPFDDSAVTAVKDIGRLPQMQYLKPNDFQPYRSFKMTFSPEDLAS